MPRFLPSNFVVFRSPVLPYRNEAGRLFDQIDSLPIQKRFLQDDLRIPLQHTSDATFQELVRQLAEEPINARQAAKLKRTLFKYFIRMSTRCTPFGLLAGVFPCRLGPGTEITLEGQRSHVRLDGNAAHALASALFQEPDIRNGLRYYPNGSLKKYGDNFHYIEEKTSTGKKRSDYELSAIESTPYLERLLQRATGGATVSDLAIELTSDAISLEEATDYIQALINEQVLLPELFVNTTGIPFLDRLQSILEPISPVHAGRIAALRRLCEAPYTSELPEKVSDLLQSYCPDLPDPHLSIDLLFEAPQAQLDQNVAEAITNAAEDLWPLMSRIGVQRLEKFAEHFQAYYEQQEVDLLTALDPEAGIGYHETNEALNQIELPDLNRAFGLEVEVAARQVDWTEREQFLLEKLTGAPVQELRLEPSDLKHFKTRVAPRLADTLFLFGSLLSSSPHPKDEPLFLLTSITEANLLARFTPADQRLEQLVREMNREREGHGPLCAEIAYSPHSGAENVITRGHLRDFEIPILYPASDPAVRTIPLSDLRVSVQGGSILLRSKTLNREVRPCLSSAYIGNLSKLPLFNFLYDLQKQGAADYGWHWGPFTSLRFLPRVRYRNLILSPARWLLRRADVEVALDLHQAERSTKEEIDRIRATYNLPRLVQINQADNLLLVDLDTDWGRETLLQEFKRRKELALTEFIEPKELLIKSRQGGHLNEVIIPVCTKADPGAEHLVRSMNRNHTQEETRTHFPVEDWVYVKIYAGPGTLGAVLHSVLPAVLRKLQSLQWKGSWFFLRYNDPGYHLRIRFRADEAVGSGELLRVWQSELKERIHPNLIRQLELDTYKPELERYRADVLGMSFSERVFQIDSEFALNIGQAHASDPVRHHQFFSVIQAIEDILCLAGLNLSERISFCHHMESSFLKDFERFRGLKENINQAYRPYSKRLIEWMNRDRNSVPALTRRYESLRALFAGCSSKELAVIATEVVSSYIHMLVNRVFASAALRYELYCYSFLRKYLLYLSTQKKQSNTQVSAH